MAASERSEARAYAAALRVDLVPSQAEVDGWLADYRFRGEYVAATCLDVVEQGVRDHDRGMPLFLTYTLYSLHLVFARNAAWSRAVDDRLAAIPTRSRALRRGRAARRVETATLEALTAAAPEDFCHELRDWQAKGWKGRSPAVERLLRLADWGDAGGRRVQRMVRAAAVLERHGVSRRLRWAFAGTRPNPHDAELPDDPVFEALEGEPERKSPGGGPTRRP